MASFSVINTQIIINLILFSCLLTWSWYRWGSCLSVILCCFHLWVQAWSTKERVAGFGCWISSLTTTKCASLTLQTLCFKSKMCLPLISQWNNIPVIDGILTCLSNFCKQVVVLRQDERWNKSLHVYSSRHTCVILPGGYSSYSLLYVSVSSTDLLFPSNMLVFFTVAEKQMGQCGIFATVLISDWYCLADAQGWNIRIERTLIFLFFHSSLF